MLNLSSNRLDTACTFALASPLRSLTRLTELRMGRSNWSAAGLAVLLLSMNHLTGLRCLDVATRHHVSASEQHHLAALVCRQLTGLRKLRELRLVDEGLYIKFQYRVAIRNALPHLDIRLM